MSIDKKKITKFIGIIAAVTGAAFVGLHLLARKKKADSVYDKKPEQKNPLAGKKVVFVESENDVENADGVRGHLEAIGESSYTPGFYDRYVKRIIDVTLSFIGLVLLSPVFAGIAIAIKIDDPGLVFFTQKRLGKNKEYFQLHKFRSMKMSTPHDVPTHMLDNPEQYITRVGKFLRAHSLDELPQIWDIFIGNMSIIGPRPGLWNQDVLTAERDKYGANDIKPGLTGWAQINGRDELEIPEKAKLDGEYVEKESLLFDIKCFLGTVSKVRHDDSVVEGGTGTMDKVLPLPSIAECKDNLDFTQPKKILIAGAGSYIGESFKTYMSQFENYTVDAFDTLSDEWKNLDFSSYDAVYDVAGIAHIKETDKNRHLYYEVNRDLAVAIAEKAKAEGVKQFIYLSSMSVYGLTEGRINEDTPVKPVNAYGKSKLEAEKLLWQLNDESFVVSIVRPPMVYGKDCKGNYQTLRKFALKFGFFPEYNNERSMLFIDNLSSAVRGIIHNQKSGLYFPQNLDYVRTYDMVQQVAEINGKKFRGMKLINIPIKVATHYVGVLKKVFGTLTYEQRMNVPCEWIDEKHNRECLRMTKEVRRELKDKPLVTILSVSYNSAKTISKTIEAVLNQSYENIEYIIIDGASKDNTIEVVKSYEEIFENTPGRTLKIVSEPDNGMYDALNKGAKMAHGVLVGQTNTDDWYEFDAVEHMVELYNSNPYDVAWGSIRVIKPSGVVIKHAKVGKLWTTSGWCHPAMFSRREILLENPYICESMYDDFDFITSVYKKGKKIVTTDYVISNFSFGGMSTKKDLKSVKQRVDILYKVYRSHGMSRFYYFQRWIVEFAKYLMG